MAGASHHASLPADNPDLLEALAELLDTHPSQPDPRYARRLRESAATRRGNPQALTAESPIEALLNWGIEVAVVNLLKRQAELETIDELCQLDIDRLLDIKGMAMKRINAIVTVLAKHYMGLRPRRRN